MEARGFREALPEFRRLGAEVLGVSRDSTSSQERFSRRHELGYQLLSDRAGEAVRAYGVRSMLGVASRVTFLIDAEGRIAHVYGKVSPFGHAKDVLADLQRLMDSAANGRDT